MTNGIETGSLFSGIGGIELGFEQEGFETKWFVECDPFAKAILRKQFPNAIIYDNVEEVDFSKVQRVKALTGGFPCQDISNAGKRAGIEGNRSSLWKHYLRAIMQIRPEIAFIENVSALTSRGLCEVLSDLAKIGYDAEWHCVPASAVGANHQRDRIFILAYPNCSGHIYRQIEEYSTKTREQTQFEFESRANSSNLGLQDWNNSSSSKFSLSQKQWRENAIRESSCKRDVSNSECIRPSKQGKPRKSMHSKKIEERETNWFNYDGFWAIEPNVGRVADGIPFRVDRIKALGNAVVPQVAAVFAKAIKEILKHDHDQK